MGRAGRLESIRSGDWRYYWIGGPDSLIRKINKLKITAFVCHLTSLGDFTTSYIVVVNSSWFYFWTRWSWLVISRAIAKKDVYDSYSHWTPCLVLWSLVSLTSLPLVRVLLGWVGCLVFFVSFLCFAPGCSFFFFWLLALMVFCCFCLICFWVYCLVWSCFSHILLLGVLLPLLRPSSLLFFTSCLFCFCAYCCRRSFSLVHYLFLSFVFSLNKLRRVNLRELLWPCKIFIRPSIFFFF